MNEISRTSVCKRCFKSFNPYENSITSCNFHRGRFIGAENSKHMGTKSGGSNTGLSTFWDCCNLESFDGEGCMRGKHISYDNEFDPVESILLNKPYEIKDIY